MGSLERLTELAREMNEAAADVLECDERHKRAKAVLKDLQEHQIPDLMEEIGLTEFVTDDGLRVTIADNVRANISKEREAAAFAWLRENGHGAVIKTVTKTSVNYQTLGALVRELLSEGVDLPMETFGVYRQRTAKVKK